MNLLICGDSFSYEWEPLGNNIGWTTLLGEDHSITNLSIAGASEYKIYLQLSSVNLDKYDKVLISHTSPYRIPVKEHPIHAQDSIHKNCDLIYSDVCEHQDNSIMRVAKNFYEQVYDLEYFKFINELIVEKIFSLSDNFVHITFFDYYSDERILNLSKVFTQNRGEVNHLTEKGNKLAYKQISSILI